MGDYGKVGSLLDFAKHVFQSCTAYSEFLKFRGIKDINGFPLTASSLPLINKSNYIEKYSIEKRLYKDKKLHQFYMVCTSSGSTGHPTMWPRDFDFDQKAIFFNQEMYKELFDINKKSTLVVITFGLGAWTAGMLTSRLSWEAAKNFKLSVVTPGLDKEVSLRIIQKLSVHYDQTIITGYPPFIIDLVDYGVDEGFDFKSVNTKIHFTSARLLEEQRDELVRMVSAKNSRHDVIGFYASSEAGIIGVETQETVDILEYASKDNRFSMNLFGSTTPPTFVVYDPQMRYLEEHEGRLLLSVDQPVPLVRYDTKDRGGVFNGRYLSKICKNFGYRISKNLVYKNFAYVFGRTDSVRLLSNIYIEDIQYCLEKSKISHKFTGKFKYGLEKVGLKNILKIIVCLKPKERVEEREKRIFSGEIYKLLAEINPDFRMVSSGINFSFNIVFTSEIVKDYKGGKFDYFI